MGASPFPTNGTTPGASSYDADLDVLYAWMPPPAPAPQPLPEAAFSATLKGLIDGHETLLTARGMTAAEFKRNLEAIRGLLDAPTARQPVPQASSSAEGWCAVHNVAMQENAKDGRRWFSHRLPEGGWCKGRK